MKDNGFTLIELLAVIVILAIILVIAVPQILGVIRNSKIGAMESDAKLVLNAISQKKALDKEFDPTQYNSNLSGLLTLLGISGENYTSVSFSYNNERLFITIVGKEKYDGFVACGTYKNMTVKEGECGIDLVAPVIVLNGNSEINLDQGVTYQELGATATDDVDGSVSVTITGAVDINTLGTYTLTYSATDLSGNSTSITRNIEVLYNNYAGVGYIGLKGVNGPVLATGMVPIIWDGDSWEETVTNDRRWYEYGTTTGTKNWANAKTADGSMWVWIPRYGYQIQTNYHTANSGTINIKFLQGVTNTASDSSTVATTPTYSGGIQTNYILHPAFNFGGTQVTGIWVAKFEASGTTSTLESKPGVISLRSITISNAFDASRNMETNERYGWGTSGTGIDTHLIKNKEWGMVAYLSKSIYGMNNEVWINNANNYMTGCAGNSATEVASVGCKNYYYTSNGINASTSGTIYGIYDMAGGNYEYVAGYINNGNTFLTNYASSLLNANAKYKDIYVTTDNGYDKSYIGDAVYETSGTSSNATSWGQDYSWIPSGSQPCFVRGGAYSYGINGGIFTYGAIDSVNYPSAFGFRPVILVQSGL